MADPSVPIPIVPTVRTNVPKKWLQAVSSRFHWFVGVPEDDFHDMTVDLAEELTIDAIEDGTNDFVALLVASTGFFTDSYILFATNAILPMLDYVYWPASTNSRYETAINCATLAGCFSGMLSFGILADKFGRQRLYGIVLLTLIGGTLGLIMSSPGYTTKDQLANKDPLSIDGTKIGSMNVAGWLIFWRFVSGYGLGGDYPLAATMVSELAPTRKRARMLAILFSMQAFGYATATVTSIIVVKSVRHFHPVPSQISVDQTWRWVMGLSVVPATVAVIMRLFVPESPRFTLFVLNSPFRALRAADTLNQSGLRDAHQKVREDDRIRDFVNGRAHTQSDSSTLHRQEFGFRDSARWQCSTITFRNFWEYLLRDGNGRKLLVTSSTWFLLDFTFFGLGFGSPQTLARLWEGNLPLGTPSLRLWDTDYGNSSPNIYTILIQDNVRSLLTSSLGAIVGALLLIFTIERWNRKRLQYAGFGILTLLFIVIGSSFDATVNTHREVTITLYAFTQFCFYYGPNSLTFIVASELFSTKFRTTCHGISAASGKLGSIIALIVLAYAPVPCGSHKCHINNPQSSWLGWILLIFAIPMALGCLITLCWLPELQEKAGPGRYDNVSLEALTEKRQSTERSAASQSTTAA